MNTKSAFEVYGPALIALSLLIAWPVRGDGTNDDYTGSDWALMNAGKVLAVAANVTPEKFPNCDDATVDGKSVRFFRPDGTGESQDETFVKVLTEKGRRDNRTLSFGFMLPYTTVAVAKLEVIKPDGQIVPVDVAANSKESIDDSQMAENIYDPNDRVLRVNIPKLETGDIVHLVARQTTERPLIPGEFDDENVFEGDGYIRHLSYEVHAPAGHPLQRIALRDEVPGPSRIPRKRTPIIPWFITGKSRMCRACMTKRTCRPMKWSCSAFLSAPRPTGRRFQNGIGI